MLLLVGFLIHYKFLFTSRIIYHHAVFVGVFIMQQYSVYVPQYVCLKNNMICTVLNVFTVFFIFDHTTA
jgi:hypothetical protein